MIDQDVIDELAKLAEDLYQQGYICGISDERWYRAYALAMQRVAAGSLYEDEMVSKAFSELFPES